MKFASHLAVVTVAATLVLASLTGATWADDNQPQTPGPNRPQAPVAADPMDTFKPLSDIDVDLRIDEDKLPTDASKNLFTPPERYSRAAMGRDTWPEVDFTWEVSELLYQPLYFDDAPLERYGQTTCRALQPAVSAAHFFGTALVMPYRLAMDHPYGYISQLGYYRPGSPTPPVGHRVRRSVDPRWLHPSGYWRDH